MCSRLCIILVVWTIKTDYGHMEGIHEKDCRSTARTVIYRCGRPHGNHITHDHSSSKQSYDGDAPIPTTLAETAVSEAWESHMLSQCFLHLWNKENPFINWNILWEHSMHSHYMGRWDCNGKQDWQDTYPLVMFIVVGRTTIHTFKKIKHSQVVISTIQEINRNNWKITKIPTFDRKVWEKPFKEW